MQKDTIPENDCENIKYNSRNTTTAIQEPEQNNNFFFGLFK
jgi:hypothetical protein